MDPTAVRTDTTLELRHIFKAPRERVFEAWTNPALLTQWFHPSEKMTTDVGELDLRVGGRYCFHMRGDENTYTIAGTYQEVDPPQKLAFTWQWQAEEPTKEMLVTLSFHAVDANQTEVVLVHERFPNTSERDNHEIGWKGNFGQLDKLLS